MTHVVKSISDKTQNRADPKGDALLGRGDTFFYRSRMNRNPIMERDIEMYGTFVRELIKPGAQEGMDATKVRTFRIVTMPARIEIPEDAEFDVVEVPNIGDVPHARFACTDVFFHNGLEARSGVVEGLVSVYVKTWERCGPNGEDLNKGYRNYAFFVDVLDESTPVKELKIYDTISLEYIRNVAPGRKHRDQIMDYGVFCHVSGDKKRDQHLAFVDLEGTSRNVPSRLDPLGRQGGLHIAGINN